MDSIHYLNNGFHRKLFIETIMDSSSGDLSKHPNIFHIEITYILQVAMNYILCQSSTHLYSSTLVQLFTTSLFVLEESHYSRIICQMIHATAARAYILFLANPYRSNYPERCSNCVPFIHQAANLQGKERHCLINTGTFNFRLHEDK
jgi:hypothetical protein